MTPWTAATSQGTDVNVNGTTDNCQRRARLEPAGSSLAADKQPCLTIA
jgi:hypothetical protein